VWTALDLAPGQERTLIFNYRLPGRGGHRPDGTMSYHLASEAAGTEAALRFDVRLPQGAEVKEDTRRADHGGTVLLIYARTVSLRSFTEPGNGRRYGLLPTWEDPVPCAAGRTNGVPTGQDLQVAGPLQTKRS
jgi:hypothetical protein